MSVDKSIIGTMENTITYEISRSLVEFNYDIKLTDEQWQELSNQLYDTIDHYVWLDLPKLLEDLD